MRRPRSVPPSPSGEPNAFRIAPAAGSGTWPLASPKAISGFRRAGSAPRAARARASISAAAAASVGARAAARLAGGVFAVQPGDEVLERRRLPGEVGRALPLRAERVLRRGERLLARVDEGGETHFIDRQRLAPV